ncbi:MAG: beta-mannanase, partial [Ruminiclostridium sp.]|nr:beta-mannanase [Ruminiclostridium sp.]
MNNTFKRMAKRIIAAVLAGSILITSLSACNSSSGSPRSKPVAVDEDGRVDMEVALKYETDVDALTAELESREADPGKPVSQHLNKKTLEVFNYLREIYGTKTLVAQQMLHAKGYEDDVYYKDNKDNPA